MPLALKLEGAAAAGLAGLAHLGLPAVGDFGGSLLDRVHSRGGGQLLHAGAAAVGAGGVGGDELRGRVLHVELLLAVPAMIGVLCHGRPPACRILRFWF